MTQPLPPTGSSTSDLPTGPDLDAAIVDLQRELATIVAWRADVAAVQGRGSSPDGLAKVVVDSGGRVLRIEVTDAGARAEVQALAQAVIDANTSALRHLSRQLGASMAEAQGPDSPLTQQLLSAMEQQFGTPMDPPRLTRQENS